MEAVAALVAVASLLAVFLLYPLYLSPAAAARRLRNAGFSGPAPSFPLGNLREIASSLAVANKPTTRSSAGGGSIHAAVFPYFARWRGAFGKVFVYWLGTEPFLYVADPEFLKAATAGALGKLWGKPDVFRRDRMPMFGRGLVMAEGDEWARHRHIIAPAFSATNLNDMIGVMEETTARMVNEWGDMVAAGNDVIDVEKGVVRNAAEIIAKASFGIDDGDATGAMVFSKLQEMQAMLFRSTRLVGVPLAGLLQIRATYDAWKLGREIDALLLDIIATRRRQQQQHRRGRSTDLLALLLAGNEAHAGVERKLTSRELVDECKTFFFGGHETTALALSWTLLMLAAHPDWQSAVRDEIFSVAGDESGHLDAAALSNLPKTSCVLNEVLRLYPPSPNVQRQALHDVTINNDNKNKNSSSQSVIIPKGTNMWIDVVAMHRDVELWGEDADLFRPERFMKEAVQGGCRHRMGFVPFGFGGRICVGRNLTAMELRVVLAMVLRRFELEVAPEYRHQPKIMLSLRPSHGIQLRLKPLK
uniref:Cytochrome P450 n=1 Tax=Leersia perrieri TaxID=77586 RepID=A0A0D9VMW3_9ORYZ